MENLYDDEDTAESEATNQFSWFMASEIQNLPSGHRCDAVTSAGHGCIRRHVHCEFAGTSITSGAKVVISLAA